MRMALGPDKDLKFACGSTSPIVGYHEVVEGGHVNRMGISKSGCGWVWLTARSSN